MNRQSLIYVAGHRGLAGSAILSKLQSEGYERILTRSSQELDLRDNLAVSKFFEKEAPEYIFFAAGKVGGILANNTFPADFIYDNGIMAFNVIGAAHRYKVKKLLYLGSSCVYPKQAPQPIQEDSLLTGPLEETNKPYALSKIAGIELCRSYNRQYGSDFICLMPTNLFGINDNYDLQSSHLVAALIRKFHEAKVRKDPFVQLWGTGRPRREILCSNELAEACLHFMLTYNGNGIINIGKGHDYTIAELAAMISKIAGFEGSVQYDSSKPDGVMRKELDVSRAASLGWTAKEDMESTLRRTYKDFVENYSFYCKS